jgi:hypothetical protein
MNIYINTVEYLQNTEAKKGVKAAVGDASKLLQSTTVLEVLLAANEYIDSAFNKAQESEK